MKKGLLLFLCIGIVLWGADVDTKVDFGNENYIGKDKYGSALYERDVTIKTTDYKVDNFWKKFSFGGKKEDSKSFDLIETTGKVRITLESTSACTLDNTLSSMGCSGQKPFLINNEVLTNPIGGTTDEFEVVFTEAPNFKNTDQYGFYPLDILRDAQYYKDPDPDNPTAPKQGFFSFFTSAFDFIFSKTIGFGNDFFGKTDIADVEYSPRSDAAEDRRQRYIANIIAGVEQDKRMTKPNEDSSATQINAPTLNDPVSLLHYAEAKKTTENEQCKMMFLTLSSDGLMCRMMSGFGMDAWMPFFNQTKTTEIQSSYILGDTENALLAMTGKIQNVPYMSDIGGDDDTKLSFLQEMFKPMTTMMGIMKSMMFGSDKASKVGTPAERVYTFDEDEAMRLTFAVTNDGSQVDDFENFQLLKIRSVYGDMFNSCTVKKKPGMFSWSSWEETFYIGGTESKYGPDGNMDSDEWVDWCQEATDKKGMFDYLFDWDSGAFFNPFNWMKGMFSAFLQMMTGSYEITDFTNKVGRGLILELKKVQPDPTSPLNTRKVKLMSIER
ncbi:MAG: hypothetical protein ABXS93_06340 [Sulfurimonas sp.]